MHQKKTQTSTFTGGKEEPVVTAGVSGGASAGEKRKTLQANPSDLGGPMASRPPSPNLQLEEKMTQKLKNVEGGVCRAKLTF